MFLHPEHPEHHQQQLLRHICDQHHSPSAVLQDGDRQGQAEQQLSHHTAGWAAGGLKYIVYTVIYCMYRWCENQFQKIKNAPKFWCILMMSAAQHSLHNCSIREHNPEEPRPTSFTDLCCSSDRVSVISAKSQTSNYSFASLKPGRLHVSRHSRTWYRRKPTTKIVTKPKTTSVFVHKCFLTFAFCRLTTQFPPSSLTTWVLCCKFPLRSHKTELFILGSLWLTNHFLSCSEYCTLSTIKVHNIVVMMQ